MGTDIKSGRKLKNKIIADSDERYEESSELMKIGNE